MYQLQKLKPAKNFHNICNNNSDNIKLLQCIFVYWCKLLYWSRRMAKQVMYMYGILAKGKLQMFDCLLCFQCVKVSLAMDLSHATRLVLLHNILQNKNVPQRSTEQTNLWNMDAETALITEVEFTVFKWILMQAVGFHGNRFWCCVVTVPKQLRNRKSVSLWNMICFTEPKSYFMYM